MSLELNLPGYNHKIKNTEQGSFIFCVFRRKYVKLTPEEWVRQNFALFLVNEKAFPKGVMALEYSFKLNNVAKRADIVVFDSDKKPFVIVECKAAHIELNQQTADQAASYAMALGAKYLILTNGIRHICMLIDKENKKYIFARQIPLAKEIFIK